MVSGRVTDAVWAGDAESVTVNVSTVVLAAVEGVPVIAPEAVLRDRLDGKRPPVRAHV